MKLKNIRRGLHLFGHFFLAYPVRSVLMVLFMLVAALAEGLGIAAVLPLISLVIGSSGDQGALGQFVEKVFAVAGLELSIGILLTAIVVLMTLKALLVLLAMAQVGFTAAQVTMDLRLKVLRAVMDARWRCRRWGRPAPLGLDQPLPPASRLAGPNRRHRPIRPSAQPARCK